MIPNRPQEVLVIGGGIVGLAVARALARSGAEPVAVVEAEDQLATHQTGHNSGVIHSGLYYAPGSLKARLSVEGARELYHYCAEHGVPHERCGKLVLATTAAEIERLDALEHRGRANGVEGLKRLSGEEIGEREPAARGVAGLWVPSTGIVDFRAVADGIAAEIAGLGVALTTSARVEAVRRLPDGFAVETTAGTVEARHLIACAGLQADRVAGLCGLRPGLRIVPFRGEYFRIKPARAHLVRNLIYPVPDPRFPFLGVHLTRTIGGTVEAGPNAVPALGRTAYRRGEVSARDLGNMLSYPGFWRLALRYGRTGVTEALRSLSRGAFARALARLVPEIRTQDIEPHGAGIRAQAVAPDGTLIHDFALLEDERVLHVLNAPSPAATACLAIGREIAHRAVRAFGLGGR